MALTAAKTQPAAKTKPAYHPDDRFKIVSPADRMAAIAEAVSELQAMADDLREATVPNEMPTGILWAINSDEQVLKDVLARIAANIERGQRAVAEASKRRQLVTTKHTHSGH